MAIKTLDELKKIREQNKSRINLRQGEEFGGEKTEILVGMATCGIAAGARETMNAITERLTSGNISGIKMVPVGCMGYCNLEPIVVVNVPGQKSRIYGNVNKSKAVRIVESDIINGVPITDLLVEVDLGPA